MKVEGVGFDDTPRPPHTPPPSRIFYPQTMIWSWTVLTGLTIAGFVGMVRGMEGLGMDLELDVLRTRGRAAKPVAVEVVRELCDEDLKLLAEEKGSKPLALQRLSYRHHALAKALARGVPPGEAALIHGYSIGRVSILSGDPAFKELIDFYKSAIVDPAYEKVVAENVNLQERLTGLAVDAIEELRIRVEDSPEDLTPGQLIEMSKLGADRTGHGPQTTSNQNVNVNVNLASRLEAARKRVAANVIDLEPVVEAAE